MGMDRRDFLASLVALSLARAPSAQTTVKFDLARFICGYPPGGAPDGLCRSLAAVMVGSYANNFLVENKTGASGRLAVEELKRAAPDGATLLVTPASVLTMYPYVFKQLNYDPMIDLVPVSKLASLAFALVVGPKVPHSVRDIAEFIAWCKANPKSADCGNAGAGSLPHFLAIRFAQETGVNLNHVFYKGSTGAMQDLLGGQVSAVMSTEASALPLIQSGRLRALATSWEMRSTFLPNVLTFKEQALPRLTQTEWFGAFLPKSASQEIVLSANSAISKALETSEVRDTMQKYALNLDRSSANALRDTILAEQKYWGNVIKASGFTPES